MSEYTYPDLYTQNQKKSTSHTSAASAKKYMVEGYTPPQGITGVEGVKEMQRWLGGLTVDEIWGRS